MRRRRKKKKPSQRVRKQKRDGERALTADSRKREREEQAEEAKELREQGWSQTQIREGGRPKEDVTEGGHSKECSGRQSEGQTNSELGTSQNRNMESKGLRREIQKKRSSTQAPMRTRSAGVEAVESSPPQLTLLSDQWSKGVPNQGE